MGRSWVTRQTSVLWLGLALAVVGCGEDDAAPACVRNQAIPCRCPSGMEGASICDGEAFQACRCELTAGQGGAAGFAGVGGTGGSSGTGGTGGSSGTGGAGGSSGTGGAGGSSGTGGAGGSSGTGGTGGSSGTGGTGGSSGAGGDDYGAGETGRLVGFTAAHNAVRARSHSPQPSPALPPMRWSTSLAASAQAYANQLASNCAFQHSGQNGVGENLAGNGGYMSTPQMVTEAWAGEEQCWTYGTFYQGDDCNMTCTAQMSSNGCGHYTQIMWRETTQLGCGVATCSNGNERWVCQYSPQGNWVGELVY